MGTIGEERDLLAQRLATIDGLRSSSFIPDKISPPHAAVGPPVYTYDATQDREADTIEFPIWLMVSRASTRSGQVKVDAFLDKAGDSSIKAAIDDAQHTVLDAVPQSFEVGDVIYIGYALRVRVFA